MVSISSCMGPPALSPHPLLFISPVDLSYVFPLEPAHLFSCQWCIQSTIEHNFTCPSFLNGSLLFGLVCLCVYQCVRLFWVSSGLLLDFFSSALNFTCFAISDRVNQCDRSTLSILGGRFYTASVEFFCSPKQRRNGCQQGQTNRMICWQSKSQRERGGGHFRLNVSTWYCSYMISVIFM